MAREAPPYWLLISVLFSSVPLTPSLAMTLHEVAFDLYRHKRGAGKVHGDLVSGTVTNLKKEVLVGTIGGPIFEAEIETERGPGQVRFLLTRHGLDLMKSHAPPPRHLMN